MRSLAFVFLVLFCLVLAVRRLSGRSARAIARDFAGNVFPVLTVALFGLTIFSAAARADDGASGVSTWLAILSSISPIIAVAMVPLAGWVLAKLTGLEVIARDWLTSHKAATAARVLDAAWSQVTDLATTSASVISGKIQSGELDWTDRAAWQKAAVAEVALIKARAPAAVATIAQQSGALGAGDTLLAQVMGAVDKQYVASPTLGQPTPAPAMVATLGASMTPAEMVADAVKTIADVRAAIGPVAAPRLLSSCRPEAPSSGMQTAPAWRLLPPPPKPPRPPRSRGGATAFHPRKELRP